MRNSFLIVLLYALGFGALAQVVDPTFQTSITNTPTESRALLLDDGKYLLFGSFFLVNGQAKRGLAKFNANGTLDATFNTSPNNSVEAAALQTDGKILIAGNFTTINGTPRGGLARLNGDGTLDPSFQPQVLSAGFNQFCIAIQADGKVLVGGGYTAVVGTSSVLLPGVNRFNTDGTRDTSFSGPSLNSIFDIEIQSDGKIIVGGAFPRGLARLTVTGAVDNSFTLGTSGFDSFVYDTEVTSDDKIIVAGNFTQLNGSSMAYVCRLNANGTLDGTYAANNKFNNTVFSIHLLSDGQLLVAGFFNLFDGTSVNRLARLSPAGVRDATLSIGTGPGATGLRQVMANSTGDILVTGVSMTTFNGQPRNHLAIVNSTGTLRATAALNLRAFGEGRKIVAQGTDKLLLAADGEVNGTTTVGLVRLNLNGTIDGSFLGNSKPSSSVSAIALGASGSILIGGFFTAYDGVTTNHVARLSATGVRDATFTTNGGAGLNGAVSAILPLPDGKILLGGGFTSFNGTARRSLLRLNADGSLDATFNAGNGFLSTSGPTVIRDLAVQADGKILVAGEFEGFAGIATRGLFRLNVDGTHDPSFLIGTGISRSGAAISEVTGVKVLSNNKILIGGSFDRINGVSKLHLAVLNTDGTIDNSIVYPNFINLIQSLQAAPDGKYWAGIRATGQVFRLNADGSFDSSFDILPTSSWVTDFAGINGNIVLTGLLNRVAGNQVSGIARVVFPTAVAPTNLEISSFNSSQIELTWSDNSTDETAFEVYRSISDAPMELFQTLPANTVSFTNTGLNPITRYSYQIRAVTPSNSTAFSNKASQTTTPNEWQPIATTLPPRRTGVAVTANGRAYMGLGRNATGRLKDWWEVNPITNQWVQKSDFPGSARDGAVAFGANGRVYVGTGNDGTGGFERDFYEYDPASDAWTRKADFPEDFAAAAGITSGVAFSIDNIGYVGLGNTGVNNTQAFFKYNPGTNAWQSSAAFPGPGRIGAIAFVTGGKAYVGFGFGSLGPYRNDLFEYDPVANTWTTRASGSGTGRGGAAAVTLNGRGLVLAGIENTTGGFGGTDVYTSSNFVYNPALNTWSLGPPVPSPVRTDVMSFAIGTKAYLHGGFRFSGTNIFLSDFYAFTPTSDFFPAAPSNLTATFNSTTSIRCNWQDNSTNESGFVLEFAIGASNTFAFLAQLQAGVTEFLHTGLVANTQYKYRVRAINEFQGSAFSNIAVLTTTPPPTNPTGLVAEATSATTYNLTWLDTSIETGYEVFRAVGGSSDFNLLQTLAANQTSYTDATGVAGTRYAYRVRAFNAGGPSSFSNTASPPLGPSGLTAVSASLTSLEFTWTDNSDNEAEFEIFRSTGNNSNFTLVLTRPANSTSAVNTGLLPNTTYFYRVRAVNGLSGLSVFSNEISQTTLSNIPAAPTNLAVQSVNSNQIVLTWVDNATNETGYSVERSVGTNLSFEFVAGLAANTTTFTNGTLLPNTTYFYRVRATSGAGASAFSNEVSATTAPPPPTAPSALTANALSATEVGLSWADNSTNETGFEIQRSLNFAANFVTVQTTAENATSFVDTGLTPFTQYFYRVRANGTAGSNSGFTPSTAVNTLLPPPAAPTNLAARVLTDAEIMLNWTDNSTDESGFVIERSVGANNSFSVIQTTTANVTSFINVGLAAGTVYFYRVRATNLGSLSTFSNVVSTVITGLNEPTRFGSFTAFPNPAKDTFTVKNTTTQVIKFSVYDVIGRLVVTMNCDPEAEQNVECGSWVPGVYLVHVPGEANSLRIQKQ